MGSGQEDPRRPVPRHRLVPSHHSGLPATPGEISETPNVTKEFKSMLGYKASVGISSLNPHKGDEKYEMKKDSFVVLRATDNLP